MADAGKIGGGQMWKTQGKAEMREPERSETLRFRQDEKSHQTGKKMRQRSTSKPLSEDYEEGRACR